MPPSLAFSNLPQVCQPFDPSKFNFTKAYVREVLFQFEPQQQQQKQQQQAMELSPRSSSGSLELSLGEEESRLAEASVCGDSPNLVVINVRPGAGQTVENQTEEM